MLETKITAPSPVNASSVQSQAEQQAGSSSRAALRAALVAVPAKAKAAQEAAAQAEHAQARVNAAQAALEKFGDLDQRVQAFHAESIKDSSAGTLPAIPPDLLDAKRERLLAREHLADLTTAAQAAAGRTQAAVADADAARGLVSAATIAVMREVAIERTKRFRDLERELGQERGRLSAYPTVFSSNDKAAVPTVVPWDVGKLFHDPWHSAFMSQYALLTEQYVREWAAFRKALAEDPGAEFTPAA